MKDDLPEPTELRNPYPNFNPEKATEVILYILQKCPGITQQKLQYALDRIDGG